MTFKVIINDTSGAQVFGEQDLPLNIGSSADATIRIPGPVAQGHRAQIGMLDKRVFVQVPGKGHVTVNDEAIGTTRWLEDGDNLLVDGVAIRVELQSEALLINVEYRDFDYQTAPPILPDVAEPSDVIVPSRISARKRLDETTGASGKSKYWIYAGLGLLGCAALYIFTAVTVVIGTEQGDADIELSGALLTPGGDGRYLLWPGSYDVQIDAQGFYPFSETIVVRSGGRADFQFELEELPGRLSVSAQQSADGEIWIDGEVAGVLPADEILLAKGTYELQIKTRRYLDFLQTVEIVGRDKQQKVEAELIPNWADVTVTTEPAGAEVFDDEELLGITPAVVELVAGNRKIELRKPGYKTATELVSTVAGQAKEIPLIKLQESGAVLQISSSPSNAAVTVQGDFVGNTPLEHEVDKGDAYDIKITKAGYNAVNRSVEVVESAVLPVEVELTPRIGSLTINIEPSGATLLVDGKTMAENTRELELLAVAHSLEVRKEGYETWSETITPKPGLPQQIDVVLLTPQEAVLASIPKVISTSQGQEMLLIEPGEFVMGAPRREQGRRPNEVRKQIQLTRRFFISVNEVSNRQFREFKPQHTSGAEKYRELAADNNPAVMMSWEDAAEYCNWLSEKEGLAPAYVRQSGQLLLADPVTEGYRLPTEAEWSWVARFSAGGGERKYPWGSGMPPPEDSGNFADSSAIDVASSTISSYYDSYPVTAPVGTFPANPIGIYDLGGNVAEWVNDHYSVTAGNSGVLIDPVGPAEGQYHVIRGSSWRQSSISELRLAYRDFGDRGRLDVGFRIARYAQQPE